MASKNKLLSILTALIANPAYAAMDCNNQPSCTTLGYSKENVADCASDGYIFCPFDTSYKKCVRTAILCPFGLSTCEHKIGYVDGQNRVLYYTCEDAGFFTPNSNLKCPSKATIYLNTKAKKECCVGSTALSSISNVSCGTFDYTWDQSCSSDDYIIPVEVLTSVGTFDCVQCIKKTAAANIGANLITVANISEEQCAQTYCFNLADGSQTDDCEVYIA